VFGIPNKAVVSAALPPMPNVADFMLNDKLLLEAYSEALKRWAEVCIAIVECNSEDYF
jgi:hypothetical protein